KLERAFIHVSHASDPGGFSQDNFTQNFLALEQGQLPQVAAVQLGILVSSDRKTRVAGAIQRNNFVVGTLQLLVFWTQFSTLSRAFGNQLPDWALFAPTKEISGIIGTFENL